MKNQRPSASEYNEYYKRYIDQATGDSLLTSLEKGKDKTLYFFKNLPIEKQEYRYAPDKWTPKEIVQHITDTERVFCYRALQFARADNVVIRGFDQDEFAANANTNDRTMEELLDEYAAVREASILFAMSCKEDTLLRMGVASNSPLSVRAALYILVGHEIHHRKIIEERYL